MKRVKQYLIQINHGALKGETAWAFRNGDEFVRGSCIGSTINYPIEEVTVLATRWYEDRKGGTA